MTLEDELSSLGSILIWKGVLPLMVSLIWFSSPMVYLWYDSDFGGYKLTKQHLETTCIISPWEHQVKCLIDFSSMKSALLIFHLWRINPLMGAYMIIAHLRDSLKSKWSNFHLWRINPLMSKSLNPLMSKSSNGGIYDCCPSKRFLKEQVI